jgi:hypothetical protein
MLVMCCRILMAFDFDDDDDDLELFWLLIAILKFLFLLPDLIYDL